MRHVSQEAPPPAAGAAARLRDRLAGVERSPESVRVGVLRAGVGAVRRGRLWVTAYVPDLMPPVAIVGGSRPGPVVAIVGGVHGGETASIQAVRELVGRLRPDALAGTVILVPVANVAAFRDRRPFVNPLDGQDLNESFPGAGRGGPTTRLAHALSEHVLTVADVVIDLHAGELIQAVDELVLVEAGPSSSPSDAPAAAMDLAEVFGLARVIVTHQPRSLIAAAQAMGKPAIAAQAAQRGTVSPSAGDALRDGALRVLAALGMWPEAPPAAPALQLHAGWAVATSTVDGFWLPAIQVGDRVQAGQPLGTVDPLDGTGTPADVSAPADGRVVGVVISLAAAASTALVLIARPETAWPGGVDPGPDRG